MALKKQDKIENLLYVSNINNKRQEKDKKKKNKEREKRIRKNKANDSKKDKFDYETEIVLEMTNKNKEKKEQEINSKIANNQKKKNKRNKKIKKLIQLVAILALIIGGMIFALISPIFNINEIQVENNNNQVNEETIISLSGLKTGNNIFKFSKNKVKKQIKKNAYIEEVNVKRIYPNKVKLEINERERNFNIEFLNGYVYINNQGYILEKSEQKLELPTIQGISTKEEQIVEGNRLEQEDLKKLETVLQIINICKDYELDTKITKIDISNESDYIMYMDEEKKTVYIGDSTNLSTKMLYVQAIMEKNKDKEGSIYVDGDFNTKLKARFKEKV